MRANTGREAGAREGPVAKVGILLLSGGIKSDNNAQNISDNITL